MLGQRSQTDNPLPRKTRHLNRAAIWTLFATCLALSGLTAIANVALSAGNHSVAVATLQDRIVGSGANAAAVEPNSTAPLPTSSAWVPPPRKVTRWSFFLAFVYCVFIVAASFCGGWLPFAVELTHTRMQLVISLVGGVMLGIAVFHLLPHSVAETASIDRTSWWLMIGMLMMFAMIRLFHFHSHDVSIVGKEEQAHDHDHDADDHQHHHEPHHHHDDHHHAHSQHVHPLNWLGVTIGLALHTLIDGLALGASIQADAAHGESFLAHGLGTFAAILLHKPLDAISITSLMIAGGWSARWRHMVNGGFALMCPLGAALFFLGIGQFTQHQAAIVGCALAFSAGVFLCISLGDLLPEVEFHAHDRVKLSFMLLLGVALAYAIVLLEPAHVHPTPLASPPSKSAPPAAIQESTP